MRVCRKILDDVRGEIRLTKRNIVTGKSEEFCFHNLIVTGFANKFCNGTNGNFLTTSSGEGASPAGLVVGDGTDAPSSSDTALTHQLFSVGVSSVTAVLSADCRTATATLVFTIPATASYVGTLAECGLTAGGTLVTHSLFEDAEGTPITIEKTDLDEITVTYVVYISSSGAAGAGGLIGSNGINCFAGDISYSWTWGTNYAYLKLSMKKFLLSYDADYVYSKNEFYADFAQAGPAAGYLAYPVTRFVQAHAYNDHFVQCILAIGQSGRVWMPLDVINLPDNDVMLQALLEDYTVGTGDGTETDFVPPIPAWLNGTETVYVDGIAKTRGVDYTCDCKHNLQGNPELFPLFHANIVSGNVGSHSGPYISQIYMTDNGTEVKRINGDTSNTRLVGYASRRNNMYNRTQMFLDNTHPFIFELLDDDGLITRSIDCIYLFTRFTNDENAASYDIVDLDVSDDKETWTSVLSGASGYKAGRSGDSPMSQSLTNGWVRYDLATPISARYWRLTVRMKSQYESYDSYHDSFGLILRHAGQPIHFTTAPAADARISMDCRIDRIWKDNQHVADVTATYTV